MNDRYDFADSFCAPTYTWEWNGTVTKEEIDRQIAEFAERGIQQLYVLPVPERFRKNRCKTHLSLEYLSDEYMEMLRYAYDRCRENGIRWWLYNEGGFPSGMGGGHVLEENPDLGRRYMTASDRHVRSGEVYEVPDDAIAAFHNHKRICGSFQAEADTVLREYRVLVDKNEKGGNLGKIDIGNPETAKRFLRITHERLYHTFKDEMGKDILYMFDDEAYIGNWTKDFEKIFIHEYGYDFLDYLPLIIYEEKGIETEAEKQAFIDYSMLRGRLMCDNYFLPCKKWLNDHGMKAVGHLNGENQSAYQLLIENNMDHGNIMELLRCFDVPGIDEIWGQISWKKNGKCCKEGFEFYPRLASSAARQVGSPVAISESFAVTGAHLTPEEMRMILGFQAVRGINSFNYMAISFERKGYIPFQYRPNFIKENPCMDSMQSLDTYIRTLSSVLRRGDARIHTALYYPIRSMIVRGKEGKAAFKSFEDIGHALEREGVSFDIIDEAFVGKAQVRDGCLCGEHVTYEEVFVPTNSRELAPIIEKLVGLSSKVRPLMPDSGGFMTRCVDDEDESYYFLFNEENERRTVEVTFAEGKHPYKLNMTSGEIHEVSHTKADGRIRLSLTMERGEGAVFLFSDRSVPAKAEEKTEYTCTLSGFESAVRRIYTVGDNGIKNEYPPLQFEKSTLSPWEKSFSGEVTYKTTVPAKTSAGEYILDMGEVRHAARVTVNNRPCGTVCCPPYRLTLGSLRAGDEICITVANTAGNACAVTEYFAKLPKEAAGPYYPDCFAEGEANAPAGGLIGPVSLHRVVAD